jgi:hypothetical protein
LIEDHFRLFPRAIGEIVQHSSTQEFHLSLTKGFWFQERWGTLKAPFDPASVPSGAMLYAWLEAPDVYSYYFIIIYLFIYSSIYWLVKYMNIFFNSLIEILLKINGKDLLLLLVECFVVLLIP